MSPFSCTWIYVYIYIYNKTTLTWISLLRNPLVDPWKTHGDIVWSTFGQGSCCMFKCWVISPSNLPTAISFDRPSVKEVAVCSNVEWSVLQTYSASVVQGLIFIHAPLPPLPSRAVGVDALAGPQGPDPQAVLQAKGNSLHIWQGGRQFLKIKPCYQPTNRNISPAPGSRPGAWSPNERISIRNV